MLTRYIIALEFHGILSRYMITLRRILFCKRVKSHIVMISLTYQNGCWHRSFATTTTLFRKQSFPENTNIQNIQTYFLKNFIFLNYVVVVANKWYQYNAINTMKIIMRILWECMHLIFYNSNFNEMYYSYKL